jgi:hypothetical protein
MSLTDIEMASIYKVLYYDYNYKNDIMYTKYPSMPYGFSVSFELWIDDANHYYIVMRENFNDSPVFILTKEKFCEFLEIILLNPDYTATERQYYCGNLITTD